MQQLIQWGFTTTEAATKQSVLSWTGDARLITKSDLALAIAFAFAEATSFQKGDGRLPLKSDLDGMDKQLLSLKSDLVGLDKKLGETDKKLLWGFWGSVVLHGLTLWSVNRKK